MVSAAVETVSSSREKVYERIWLFRPLGGVSYQRKSASLLYQVPFVGLEERLTVPINYSLGTEVETAYVETSSSDVPVLQTRLAGRRDLITNMTPLTF